MQQHEVSTNVRRRALQGLEIGPAVPNFALTCPDCGHETGFVTLHPSWRCAGCQAQWRLKMCRHCHRHLEIGEDGPYCQGTLRCGTGRAAIASSSH
jgi:transposase-like protein